MQLIEYFIWKNINNKWNGFFTILAALLLIIQPIASLMMLHNIKLRNILLGVYLLFAIPYSFIGFYNKRVYSIKSKNGHLQWNMLYSHLIVKTIWLFFFLFSFVYEKKWVGFLFGLVMLLVTYINYKNDNTMWSMWCWIVNSMMIYYAIYLLFYLPFLEKKSLC
jgi:hypothetical protein